MVIVKFPNIQMRRKALAFIMRRSSGKSWKSGEVMVPEEALPHMAAEGIVFTVQGRATYERVLRLNQAIGGSLSRRKAAAAA